MPLFTTQRCVLCGEATHQRCAYCSKPICTRCQIREKGKPYCSTWHRNQDSGIGHLLRRIVRPEHIMQ